MSVPLLVTNLFDKNFGMAQAVNGRYESPRV
jgi:hypothetical protein